MASTAHAPSALQILRLFFKDRGRSVEFGDALALRAVAQLPGSVAGLRVLDLGCGPGSYSAELERSGAQVVSVEIDLDELLRSKAQLSRPIVSDGTCLAFAENSFDAVVCSNVLEHTPNPEGVLAEIERILVPGGWAYVSWTNWYSPWGGHAVAPLHYLGPERSIRVWKRLFGEPKGRNLPLVTVFPNTIGSILRWVHARAGLQLVKAYPRYWPWARVIMHVPGLREVASWNCVLELRKD